MSDAAEIAERLQGAMDGNAQDGIFAMSLAAAVEEVVVPLLTERERTIAEYQSAMEIAGDEIERQRVELENRPVAGDAEWVDAWAHMDRDDFTLDDPGEARRWVRGQIAWRPDKVAATTWLLGDWCAPRSAFGFWQIRDVLGDGRYAVAQWGINDAWARTEWWTTTEGMGEPCDPPESWIKAKLPDS